MYRILSLFFFVFTVVAAFAPAPARFGVISRRVASPPTGAATTSSSARSMFSGDEPKPLSEVTTTVEASTEEPIKAAPRAVYRNLAKGGEEVEVPWVDDAMRANTNPLEMSWWAYILFGLPIVLLANDFLHFLPKEGPLSFMSTL